MSNPVAPKSPAHAAFAGLRVLDLTRVRAGPTCVRQFADFGADVISIETAASAELGGARDSSDFQNLHRNTRSMTLDLKSVDGKAIFSKLVKTADVVVENYRPDVKYRLGIDYDSLKALNPRIILASISGFGQDGPYADRPGFDQIAQGMSGLMSVTGYPDGDPLRVGAAVADVTAGLCAALGVMTALYERERSGLGQWVQSNLLQAGIALLDFQAARYTMSGEVATRVGNEHPTFVPTSAYKTADGYINIAAAGQTMWLRLCEALGRHDLADHPDYRDVPHRVRHRAALNALLETTLAGKTSAEWVELLNAAGIACGPIYAMDQVFADPQVAHVGAAAEVVHPRLGPLRLINQPVKLSRTPAALVTATPEQGEHTDEILHEIGYDAAEIERLRSAHVI